MQLLEKTDDELEQLVDQLTEELKSGDEVDLQALLRAHPRHEQQLRALFPVVCGMAQLSRQLDVKQWHGGGSDQPGERPFPTLGDYKILGEIGRGGMGVVYRARQGQLDRDVAVKVLPMAALADPRQLARFRNEVRATATLHHPHIVPIHTVGEERGIHYYAMQYIEGPTLAQVIRRLNAEGNGHRRDNEKDGNLEDSVATRRSTSMSDYIRTVAQWGLQAAEALAHAHDNGVVHRDIKPGNLFLDNSSNLWIADFGLARLDSSPAMTMTGDVVGTLRYMSPEQVEGRYVDHGTDVYSLGATLYELLALRPPFGGQNRQRLQLQITQDEPVNPRRVDRAVPIDLDTIVCKAMEKRPADRYPSAHEMADDLRRFLDGRSISAQPPSIPQRITKWSRRHRAVVWSALVALLIISAISALSSVLILSAYRAEAAQRRRADRLLREAEAARGLAMENARLARRAVDDMYEGVGTQWIASGAALTGMQEEFLEKAHGFYRDLVDQEATDAMSLEDRGEAYFRLVNIYYALGQWSAALDAARGAAATYEKLLGFQPASREYQQKLARAHNNAGVLSKRLGRLAEADRSDQQALSLYERLVTSDPDDIHDRLGVVRGNINRSIGGLQSGDLAQAELRARKAYDLAMPMMPESSEQADASDDWGRAEVAYLATGQLAAVLAELGQVTHAEEILRQAVHSCNQWAWSSPDNRAMYRMAGRLHGAWADQLAKLGSVEDAESAYRAGLKCLERTLRFDGTPTDVMIMFAKSFEQPDKTETLAQYMEPEIFYLHAELQGRLGQLLADYGRDEEGLKLLLESGRILCVLPEMAPRTPEYMDAFATVEQRVARLLASDDPNRAEQHLRQATESLREAVEIAPRHIGYRVHLGDALHQLGLLLAREGNDAGAFAVLEEAIRQEEAALEIRPDYSTANSQLAAHLTRLGGWLTNVADDSLRDCARAVALATQAVELAPDESECWSALAMTQYRSGDWSAAAAAAEHALTIADAAVDHLILAMARHQQGQPEAAQVQLETAVDLLSRDDLFAPETRALLAEATALVQGVAHHPGTREPSE